MMGGLILLVGTSNGPEDRALTDRYLWLQFESDTCRYDPC